MEEKQIRNVIFSPEFEEYYDSIDEKVREKYDYALHIVRTQYLRLRRDRLICSYPLSCVLLMHLAYVSHWYLDRYNVGMLFQSIPTLYLTIFFI